MPSSFLLRLIAATALIACVAAGASPAEFDDSGDAPSLSRAAAHYAGAALPAAGVAIGGATLLDGPGMRDVPLRPGNHTAQLGAYRHSINADQSPDQRFCDKAAHLARSGIHSSSLYIPPPQA